MSNFASNFASLARSKLHSALTSGSRDSLSLHRWVLLKNSIPKDEPPRTTPVTTAPPPVPVTVEVEEVDVDMDDEDGISFLFPDPGDSLVAKDTQIATEEQWLDSLLEELGDDDDYDDYSISSGHMSITSEPDKLSDAGSPVEEYSPSQIAYSYPAAPYPPFHPPLIRSCDLGFQYNTDFLPAVESLYHHDVPELSTPDASEDASDDETDSLATPFPPTPSASGLVEPSLIPLPGDRQLRSPRVYTESDELSSFVPYHFDPLPYPFEDTDTSAAYDLLYQAC